LRDGNGRNKRISGWIKSNSGATLIEIVVSVTILGIMAVTFILVFTSGYKNISATGDKTQASNKASEILEILYGAGNLNMSDQQLDDMLTANVSGNTAIEIVPWGSSSLYEYPGPNTVRLSRRSISLLEDAEGFQVHVVVFCRNKTDYVELTSFYKGGKQ